jgi:hypothetical protein
LRRRGFRLHPVLYVGKTPRRCFEEERPLYAYLPESQVALLLKLSGSSVGQRGILHSIHIPTTQAVFVS